MSNEEISRIQRTSPDMQIREAQKATAKERLNNQLAYQVSSEESLEQWTEIGTFNPIVIHKKFERFEEKLQRTTKEEQTTKAEAETQEVSESGVLEQVAEDFYQRNPELQKKTLLLLNARINPDDSPERMLEKIQEAYADKALADEAIDFLIQAAETRKEVREKLVVAKERFNTQFGREIRAGRNMGVQAREFSRLGLGSPTGLRDMYREITGNPRDPQTLFKELSEKFKFSQMKNIIDFILHSIGADLKSKGASISRPELQRLFGEARTMQAILGLFRFFFGRMSLIQKQFDKEGLILPSRMNFEQLAQLLMSLLEERYPSSDKILKLAYILGISEEIAAQIIIFTQYRDAMRHISPKLFQSEKHRQELLLTLIETLSDLEDELEEEEEEDDDKEE